MTKDNYLRDENNENEPIDVYTYPRGGDKRPKPTKSDRERFLKRKAEVDAKIQKEIEQERLRLSKLLSKKDNDI